MARIPLRDRKGIACAYASVDDDLAEELSAYKWYPLRVQRLQYAVRYDNGRVVLMHAQIMGTVGSGSPRIDVDHINHDGLDNRRSNLRAVSHQWNIQNRRPNVSGTSSFRGVYWHTRDNCWAAHARINGRKYHIGNFKSEMEAGEAADRWRVLNMPGYISQFEDGSAVA